MTDFSAWGGLAGKMRYAEQFLPGADDATACDPFTYWTAVWNTGAGTTADGSTLLLRVDRVSPPVGGMAMLGQEPHPADVQVLFGFYLCAAERASVVHDVAGIPLTALSVLRVNDGLWRGTGETGDDVWRLLRETGSTVADADAAIMMGTVFTDALREAAGTVGAELTRCGGGGISVKGRTLYFDRLDVDPGISTRQVWDACHEPLYAWAVAKGTLDESKVDLRLNARSYRAGLSGYNFDYSRYPSKRAAVHTVLDPMLAAARSEGDRALVQAVIDRADSLPEDAEDYPDLVEIVSIGMPEAVAAGSSEWVGRYGLDNFDGVVHVHLLAQVTRSYQKSQQIYSMV